MLTSTRLAKLTLATLLSMAAIAATVTMLPAGCYGLGSGAGSLPRRAWVDASRAFHSAIGPRFLDYVAADPTLDETTRLVLERTVADWDFMVRQGEAEVAPVPVRGVVR